MSARVCLGSLKALNYLKQLLANLCSLYTKPQKTEKQEPGNPFLGKGNLLITSTQVLRAIPKINKQALELVLMTLGYTKGSLNRLHIKTFVDSE